MAALEDHPPIRPATAARPRLRGSRAIALGALLCLLPAAFSSAQSFEVMQPGIFTVGNAWQFSSTEVGKGSFTMSWRITGVERVGNTDTVVLHEEAPSRYVLNMNVFLDQAALTLTKYSETRASQTVTNAFSDYLEKLPRFVAVTDRARAFGHGVWVGTLGGSQPRQWTRTQDQQVTFLAHERITVPAGDFDTVSFRVDETWKYDDGRSGNAQRTFWWNRTVGPVAMLYVVNEFNAQGGQTLNSQVNHQLQSFASTLPNLTVSQLRVTTSTQSGLLHLDVQWNEANQYIDAASHLSGVYLSTDTVITARDVLISSVTVPLLNPDRNAPVHATPTLPPGFLAGTYYVGILADCNNTINERDEGDNALAWPSRVLVSSKADLTVSDVQVAPTVAAPGSALLVSATVHNIGGTTAGTSWARVYLSTDTRITSSDPILVPGIAVPRIKPAGQFPFTTSGTIPAQLAYGYYYVGVVSDVAHEVEEWREDNNASTAPQQVWVTRPDLEVSSGTVAPNALRPGQNVYVQATIKNVGGFAAGPNWLGFYLSPDATITSLDLQLQSGPLCPGLLPGQSWTTYGNPIVPSSVTPGYYYVGVIADVAGAVVESHKNNNTRVLDPGRIFVGLPDLTGSGLDVAPRIVDGGDSAVLAGAVVNNGSPSPACTVQFYLSPHADLSSPTYRLCDPAALPEIGLSQSFPLGGVARKVLRGIPPGSYTLGMVIDSSNTVVESNEGNNRVLAAARVGIGSELSADALDVVPWAVDEGDSVVVVGTIVNRGSPSAPCRVDFCVSPNADLSAPRYYLCDSLRLPVLKRNGSFRLGSVPRRVRGGIPSGAYTMGIVIDPLAQVRESDRANNVVVVTGHKLYVARPLPSAAARWPLYR